MTPLIEVSITEWTRQPTYHRHMHSGTPGRVLRLLVTHQCEYSSRRTHVLGSKLPREGFSVLLLHSCRPGNSSLAAYAPTRQSVTNTNFTGSGAAITTRCCRATCMLMKEGKIPDAHASDGPIAPDRSAGLATSPCGDLFERRDAKTAAREACPVHRPRSAHRHHASTWTW